MTSKEKAEDLLDLFEGKWFARFAVEQIIEALEGLDWMEQQTLDGEYRYWDDVKKEIEAS